MYPLNTQRHLCIVINPAAGKALFQQKLTLLQQRLHIQNITFKTFFTPGQDIKGYLSLFFQEHQELNEVIVLGGDGTLNYAVNELAGENIIFSQISNGTGNDSIKSLHGILDFDQQLEIALSGYIKAFDLGICNGQYFINGVGIGFDGMVVQEMLRSGQKKKSHLAYLVTVLKTIARFREKKLQFTIDDRSYDQDVFLMTISNGRTFGGGFVINPHAKTDDGLLDICLIDPISVVQRIRHLPKLKDGSHGKIKEVQFFTAKKVAVQYAAELVAHLDGEFIGNPPFDIGLANQKLLFRVPQK